MTLYGRRAAGQFHDLDEKLDEAVARTFETAALGPDGIDMEREGLRGPSSTWTYVVNDDPFRDQLGPQLAGTGNFGVAAAAAMLHVAGPLLIAWGLHDRYVRKKPDGRERGR